MGYYTLTQCAVAVKVQRLALLLCNKVMTKCQIWRRPDSQFDVQRPGVFKRNLFPVTLTFGAYAAYFTARLDMDRGFHGVIVTDERLWWLTAAAPMPTSSSRTLCLHFGLLPVRRVNSLTADRPLAPNLAV